MRSNSREALARSKFPERTTIKFFTTPQQVADFFQPPELQHSKSVYWAQLSTFNRKLLHLMESLGLRNRLVMEDILNEAIISCVKKMCEATPVEPLEICPTYIYKAIRNRTISYLIGTESKFQTEELTDAIAWTQSSNLFESMLLISALNKLEPSERAILVLSYIIGLGNNQIFNELLKIKQSSEETHEYLGILNILIDTGMTISIGAIESRKGRAKVSLYRKLKELGADLSDFNVAALEKQIQAEEERKRQAKAALAARASEIEANQDTAEPKEAQKRVPKSVKKQRNAKQGRKTKQDISSGGHTASPEEQINLFDFAAAEPALQHDLA